MLTYPQFDPVAVSLGPVKVHWYGLMYVIGISAAWWLSRRRAQQPGFPWTPAQVEDFIFFTALGMVLGGRIGYMLFYNFPGFLADPLMIFRVWEGGMAFHGGLLGTLGAMWLYGRRHGMSFLELGDFVAPFVPIGLGAGRIGNFINGELWGKVTDLPWGMVFPTGGPLPRHPSQLYEAVLEGLVLFVILNFFSRKPRPVGAVGGVFLMGYGIFRFLVEFVREPDVQLGYLALDWVTMGQLLSLPMILGGLGLFIWAYRKKTAG
ncbi:MAG: prolipoprotein diacylglyceryl transferase [Gammaproteobacteria bacterium]|nr:prolipoprotein diacylglyceryl transferase [Gammaproteobacteria bacterium]